MSHFSLQRLQLSVASQRQQPSQLLKRLLVQLLMHQTPRRTLHKLVMSRLLQQSRRLVIVSHQLPAELPLAVARAA